MTWTTEKKDELVGLWNGVATQSQIATHLGVTRSAVSGLIGRLRRSGVDLPRRPNVAKVKLHPPTSTLPSLPKPRRTMPPREIPRVKRMKEVGAKPIAFKPLHVNEHRTKTQLRQMLQEALLNTAMMSVEE